MSDDSIGGYEVIDDVFGKPALILQVEQPRPIYAKGKETIAYIILTTLGVGVIIAAFAMVLLSKIVLSRLSSLDMAVKRISASDDLSARVAVVGRGRAVEPVAGYQQHAGLARPVPPEAPREREQVPRHRRGPVGAHLPFPHRRLDRPSPTRPVRRYFGMDDQPWPGQNFLHLLPPAARGDVDGLLRSLTVSEPAGVLECRCDMEGNARWLQWSFRAIFDRRGQAAEFQAVGRDITELKRNEEQIKASLKEKDALLKEIHHRVKNNLQIISSILSLQEAKVERPASREVLADSRNRIKSMALIHEKLYGSRKLSSIDFAEYITSLMSHLSRSYGAKLAAGSPRGRTSRTCR